MSAPKLKVVVQSPDDGERSARRFLEGDDAAFGDVARTHQLSMYRLLRRYVSAPADALDLTQRAFLQALEAKRRPSPEQALAGLRAWLFRIAINLGKNHARDAARWPSAPVEGLELISAALGPEELSERAEVGARTRVAVEQLPPRQRDVFALRVDAGLPFAEVAQALDITETNAKANFHLAVKRLRQQVLGNDGDGGKAS